MRKAAQQFQLRTAAFIATPPKPCLIRGQHSDTAITDPVQHQQRFVLRAGHQHLPAQKVHVDRRAAILDLMRTFHATGPEEFNEEIYEAMCNGVADRRPFQYLERFVPPEDDQAVDAGGEAALSSGKAASLAIMLASGWPGMPGNSTGARSMTPPPNRYLP